MARQIVRLKDVAERANVSIATASMALSMNEEFRGRLSDETRERVLQIADEMNYHPAAFAKQMKGKTSRIIGLVIPDLMNQFYPEIACGFSNTANKLGYNVILLNSRNEISREKSFIETMLEMRVDGAAICGANLNCEKERNQQNKIYRKLFQADIPVVMVDRYDDNAHFPYVGIDNYQATFMMTENLIKDGHRRIAAIVSATDVYILKERKRGYVEAMRSYGLEPYYLSVNTSDVEDIRKKSREIMESDRGFTALFNTHSDIGAIEAIRCANQLGKNIPDDISIAGFDDISVSSLLNPSLTTIAQPKYEIGKQAMKTLNRMIEENTLEAENVLLPCEFIRRDSTKVFPQP